MDLSERQIEIIEAATKLIGEGGVQSLTTKTLAAEIGFSEPALYRHFSDKNEILKTILLFFKDVLRKGTMEIIKTDFSAEKKIQAMIDFQFNHLEKNPAIIMVLFSETSFQYNTELSNMVSQIMKQKSEMVAGMIESGQQEGVIRTDISAMQLATIVMGSMRFTLLKWRLSDFNFDLLQEGKQLGVTLELLLKKV